MLNGIVIPYTVYYTLQITYHMLHTTLYPEILCNDLLYYSNVLCTDMYSTALHCTMILLCYALHHTLQCCTKVDSARYCVLPCDAMQCYAVLCWRVLCYAVLHVCVLCYTTPYAAAHYTLPRNDALHLW